MVGIPLVGLDVRRELRGERAGVFDDAVAESEQRRVWAHAAVNCSVGVSACDGLGGMEISDWIVRGKERKYTRNTTLSRSSLSCRPATQLHFRAAQARRTWCIVAVEEWRRCRPWTDEWEAAEASGTPELRGTSCLVGGACSVSNGNISPIHTAKPNDRRRLTITGVQDDAPCPRNSWPKSS